MKFSLFFVSSFMIVHTAFAETFELQNTSHKLSSSSSTQDPFLLWGYTDERAINSTSTIPQNASNTLNNLRFSNRSFNQKFVNATKTSKLKEKKLKTKHTRKRYNRLTASATNVTLNSLAYDTNGTEKANRKRKGNRRRKNKRRRKPKRKYVTTTQKTILLPNIELTTNTATIVNKSSTVSNKTIKKGLRNNVEKENGNSKTRLDGNFESNLRVDSLESVSQNFRKTHSDIVNSNSTNDVEIRSWRKIDHCGKTRGGCAHFCNRKGGEGCFCFSGFYLAEDGKNCYDIDECKTANGGCQMTCTNSLGSFECSCPPGLRLAEDSKSCEDINECLLRNGHGPCQDKCENNFGGYKCSCERLKGMVLAEDGQNCVDVDECVKENGGCSHICINTIGRAFCACPHGLELSPDWKTCTDINECDQESNKTICPNGCINTPGSYYCKNTILNIQNDDPSSLKKRVTCKPLFPPNLGYFKCSRKKSLRLISKHGRKMTVNSPRTKCRLECPTGTHLQGRYHVKCGGNGQWIGETGGKCIIMGKKFIAEIISAT